jgi:2-succinyl-5-enolpyruvyl-6-hydroxy-3-cyclohexene-1-carboxylate synthase
VNPANVGTGDPPAVAAARRLLDALVVLGVRDVVLAPGSRSAPLAYAASALADAGTIDLHVRVDERDAGFLALGLALGAGAAGDARRAPVAVVTTSGTAVANLHPAVLEAHHAGVPLVLLTADRPHELRGTGANQTTHQPGIFGSAVRLVVDVPAPHGRPGELDELDHVAARAVDAALGSRTGRPGPVQLDLAYREPLVPAGGGLAPSSGARPSGARPPVVVPVEAPAPLLPASFPARVPGTVVVAGDGAGRVAREVAESQGWPLLAEPSSGACGGPAFVAGHRLVLGVLGERVRRVVVLGRPTLSRPVQALLARAEVVVVAPGGAPWVDAARHAALVLPGVPDVWREPSDDAMGAGGHAPAVAWLAQWRAASAAARRVIEDAADEGAVEGSLDGLQVAAAVAAESRAGDVLVVGSSSPVRDLDLVAAWDEPPVVVANRGLAGIDGLVSTALGVALATGRAADAADAAADERGGRERPRVRAYLGDLTFLHDVGGLLAVRGERRPDLQLVVANDGGGSIFTTLEPGAAQAAGGAADGRGPAATFERVFGTPHDVDVAALCAAYGVSHVRVRDRDALAAALADPGRGVGVVEAVTDRAGRRGRETLLGAAVRSAVGDALEAADEVGRHSRPS